MKVSPYKAVIFTAFSTGGFLFQTWAAQQLLSPLFSVDYLQLVGLRFAYYCCVSNISDYNCLIGKTSSIVPDEGVKFTKDEQFVARTILKMVVKDSGMKVSSQVAYIFSYGYFLPFILLSILSLAQFVDQIM